MATVPGQILQSQSCALDLRPLLSGGQWAVAELSGWGLLLFRYCGTAPLLVQSVYRARLLAGPSSWTCPCCSLAARCLLQLFYQVLHKSPRVIPPAGHGHALRPVPSFLGLLQRGLCALWQCIPHPTGEPQNCRNPAEVGKGIVH